MLTKILVPIDFTECGVAALDKGRELALSTGAELVVLHVDELPIMPVGEMPYLPAYVIDEHKNSAQQRLAQAVQDVQRAGVRARGTFEVGPAYQTILEVARQEQPQLIIMGTHGRHGMSFVVRGSVTERIARTSPVPVMTVRAAGSEAAVQQPSS